MYVANIKVISHTHMFDTKAPNAGFPGGSVGKNPPAKAGLKPWAGKIPLEKEMATHCSTLAWEIPWMEECGKLQPMGLQNYLVLFFYM